MKKYIANIQTHVPTINTIFPILALLAFCAGSPALAQGGGEILWSVDLAYAAATAAPKVGPDGNIYIHSTNLYAISPAGQILWSKPSFDSKSVDVGPDGTVYSGSGGTELKLNIICANASTKVELRSVLKYSGGKVTGTWEERNFNQSGTITGSADDKKMKLNIGGGGLKGQLSVSIGGETQSVSLSTEGSFLKGVSISFARNS